MKKFYLTKNYKDIGSAGNKAKIDIEVTMDKNGYLPAGGVRTLNEGKIYSFFRTFGCVLRSSFSLSKGDVLVVQYPLKKFYSLACRLAHWKGAKVITVIHDLGAFRRKKLTVEQEIRRLSNSDVLILHNESMNKWLKENGYQKPMVNLELFDYLSRTNPPDTQRASGDVYSVAYASGLSPKKNKFIYDLDRVIGDWLFCLYGNGFEADKISSSEKYDYKGFMPSDALITNMSADFGLVWDGESIEECAGAFGEYLQYNNPHKTSLYLRCKLPVIIWKKAALAPFIQKNNLGLCVNSLRELNEILPSITPEQYNTFRKSTIEVSEKLGNGGFIMDALDKAIKLL